MLDTLKTFAPGRFFRRSRYHLGVVTGCIWMGLFCATFPAISALSPKACAQGATTGAIGGTVKDAAGGLLPNSNITITSNETKAVRKEQTSGSGEYRVTELQPGTYTVVIAAEGFETVRQLKKAGIDVLW